MMQQDSRNVVLLVGWLAADPRFTVTPKGTTVCNFRVKTIRAVTFNDKTEFKNSFHSAVAFGDVADRLRVGKEGKPIEIRGYMHTRKYPDKTTGEDRYITEVVAEELCSPLIPAGG